MSNDAPPPPADGFPQGRPSDMQDLLLSQPAGAKPPSSPSRPWEPPTAEELGKLLPDYEILKMLGRGGMGAVYMGRQKSLDRPVAIKILSTALEDADPSFAERFKNEARAMAKLSHPGIVAVYDFGETKGGLLYIVMEFIEGTDVARMIAAEGRLHTEHAMAITAHVCDALAYAHQRGIIHRDIKPANIMVGYDGVVKVADFGLAKMNKAGETGLTQSGMVMGTLHYMAPEALLLGSGVDQRADIYAVGVMLYQMLTGKIPQGMFELPSLQVKGLDPRYDGIIAKALREDRDKRYASAVELRHDLDAILTQPVVKVEPSAENAPAALETQARPQRPGGQPYRPPERSAPLAPKKKSSSAVVFACLGVLAVIAVGAFFVFKKWERNGNKTQRPSASAVSLLPGEWFRFDISASGAVPGLETDGMAKAGRLSLQDQAAHLRVPAMRDGAMRVKVRQVPSKLRMSVRSRDGEGLSVEIDGTSLTVFAAEGTRYGGTYGGKRLELPADGSDFVIQFAHTGGSYGVWINDKSVASGSIKIEPQSGTPTLHAEAAEITDLEIINLDGVAREKWPEFARIHERLMSKPDSQGPGHSQSSSVPAPSEPPAAAASQSSAATTSNPAEATKDRPFVNSLDMKFVPVPGTKVLMCIHETRRQDYAAYALENKEVDPRWKNERVEWYPEFVRKEAHPVFPVNWNDAKNFCAWLGRKEGYSYRLPTDREWSVAVGIGDKEDERKSPEDLAAQLPGVFHWGTQWPPPLGAGNFKGTEAMALDKGAGILSDYTDDFPGPAPVMSFSPNSIGLHDLGGNVSEWCEDWFNTEQKDKVLRSSPWYLGSGKGNVNLLASQRTHLPPDYAGGNNGRGFRCVIELPNQPPAGANAPVVSPTTPQPASATLMPTTKAESSTPTLPTGPTNWTDTKGRTITATFKAIASGDVLLDIAGKVTPVPLNTLSVESQKLAQDFQALLPISSPSTGSMGWLMGRWTRVLNDKPDQMDLHDFLPDHTVLLTGEKVHALGVWNVDSGLLVLKWPAGTNYIRLTSTEARTELDGYFYSADKKNTFYFHMRKLGGLEAGLNPLASDLVGRKFAFWKSENKPAYEGCLTLMADGRIQGEKNLLETNWRLQANVLAFTDITGKELARFTTLQKLGGAWFLDGLSSLRPGARRILEELSSPANRN